MKLVKLSAYKNKIQTVMLIQKVINKYNNIKKENNFFFILLISFTKPN